MNIPIEFDEKGGEFRVVSVVPFDAESGYRQYIWEQMRKEIGVKLYGLIEQGKTPVTIDISENIVKIPRYAFSNKRYSEMPRFPEEYYPPDVAMDDRIEIKVVFTPVRYRDVTFTREYIDGYAPLFVETKLDKFYSKVRKWIYRGRK